MVRDRGSIKWTSLMLPEHAGLLNELWQEDKKTVKPILDSQEIEMINNGLMAAYETQKPVILSVYRNGCVTDYIGTIVKLDKGGVYLMLTKKHAKNFFAFQDIIALIEN
ncbi:YolD-like family protein [Virgibacillus tibetensis]|uniref:YolD-like family protein n=1 Tax=Virgibacillus tibetensis TaxID=3042313 RepID=UPI002E1919B0